MNKKIIGLAEKKWQRLSQKKYKFNYVFLDNWRGFRFIYDALEVKNCRNQCADCRLWRLLKNEKPGVFSAGLYPAGLSDKKLYGPQNILNCKTVKQYRDCFVAYLSSKKRTPKEIIDEIRLIKGFKLIYCSRGKRSETEMKIKNLIIKNALRQAPSGNKKIIRESFQKRLWRGQI